MRLAAAALALTLAAALAVAAGGARTAATGAPPSDEFAAYWYAGKAELSRYELTQARYGEPRAGEAILVFVTEDLRPDALVKAEQDGGARISTLKLNRIQRFATGIYDYSLMQSVWVPVDGGRAPKATASVQDWCGHAWLQCRRRGAGFDVTGHSYFERENEQRYHLAGAWLEDELWVRARLGPDRLPAGEIQVVPGLFAARLEHSELAPAPATASLREDGGVVRYELAYADGRRVELVLGRAFPHRLEAFRIETGPAGARQVTSGRRTHTVLDAYWSHHANEHAPRRAELGLGGR